MNKRKWITATLCMALAGSLMVGCGRADEQTTDKTPAAQDSQQPKDTANANDPASRNNKYSKAPEMKIDKNKEYTATIKTNKGDIKVKLLDNEAPITVNNFVFLAQDHFYDGIKFHRVVKEFMIQTGDPLGRGNGGPGYEFQDELPPAKPYTAGVVAMANRGPNTNGSQFFIGSGDQVKVLDQNPNYTVFGEVIEGMETVKAIASVNVVEQNGEESKPTEDVHIESVTIVEK